MKLLGLLVGMFCLQSWAAPPPACAGTAEGAVRALAAPGNAMYEGAGYRVAVLRSDALRGRTWALVETCGRPDLPKVAVLVPRGSLIAVDTPSVRLPVIHIGDEVTVLARTDASQMVLHGWAEESGAVDASVRVRLPRISDDDSQPPPKIACRVTGVGTAEVRQ